MFTLLDPSHPQYQHKEFSLEKYNQKRFKNSFGISEKQFVTEIVLIGKTNMIALLLSEHAEMKFSILIGRRFLIGKFILDPSNFNLFLRKAEI